MDYTAKTETMTAEQVRNNFSDVIKRAQYSGEHILVTCHGKRAAAIIPAKQLALLEAVLEKLEYLKDVADARAALEEVEKEGTVSLEQVKVELGL